ncbi:MAG: cytochrome c-type biogenesis protein CcmH [Planctomycetes bacterium]|nr:cytochrome c-type biogenesis protein CcmH [Planctomycetota bacterium]MBI3847743.1 cytochrome c-type biogenesis protein CcmH [Planctomycetota bacterium]
MICRSTLITVVTFLLVVAVAAHGQTKPLTDEEIDKRIFTITSDMRCPCACTMTLERCECNDHPNEPWKSAFFIKNEMRKWMRQGKSDEEVRDLLVKNAGEILLQAPTFQGFNLFLYLGIPAMSLAGLALVFVVARRLTARPALVVTGGTAAAPETRDALVERYRTRIEEELRSLWR